ncbi:MAG: hypothetical protein ACQEQM_07180 [Thermoplasmatota archaeon]
MAGDGEAPSNLLRERAKQSRFKLWFFLEADRWLVTAILLLIVFVTFLLVGYLYSPAEGVIRTSDSVDTLFQALLTATITVATLVLTLNQLVLSQEFGAVGDQRERMKKAMDFRQDVADVIQAPVSPSRPAQFLRALVQISKKRAQDLKGAIVDTNKEELKEEIEDLTESLIGNADQVADGLDDAQFGTFDVISSALNFNYSWKIFTARRIHQKYSDDFNEEGEKAIERLIEVLSLFGPAREHFKTLYFQWSIINLSLWIIGTTIPALLVSVSMVAFFNASTYSLIIFGSETLIFVIALASTISLVPFFILLAYILRIATVTKHTLSIGPFILRETEDVKEVEWDR